jgi:hypothetical protein
MSERIQTDEVVVYWQRIIGTMRQRGLLTERPRQGGEMLPVADAILLPDRCIFVLDMQRLAGISSTAWLDPALWAQWRTALQGRRVSVSEGGGLAITVAREPGAHTKQLPAVIPLSLEHLPEPYHVCLVGYTKRLPASDDRAILIGGASSSDKTNQMQSAILQLAAEHSPDEVKFAVVDTQPVDLQDDERLPHLFALSTSPSTALDLNAAAELAERVEAERLRHQALMAQANLADWRRYNANPVGGVSFPLLLLNVDEAGDFAGTTEASALDIGVV